MIDQYMLTNNYKLQEYVSILKILPLKLEKVDTSFEIFAKSNIGNY